MTPEQRLLVLMELRGGPEYAARMEAAAGATGNLGRATAATGRAMTVTSQRTWLQNQALFTLRRYAFYATLAVTALGFELIKLGASYLNALQTTRVALSPVIQSTKALNNELDVLYRIAVLSPFLFKDTVVAFRQMYAAFHPLGLSLQFTNQTIQMIVNSLSYAGRTTPQAFNRVAVALQHMAFLGRPMGQTIFQLARDGLPIYAALRKELGLTADQIHNIAGSGVNAQQVMRALNRYVATTPGYMNAALRQSNRTLLGSFREFKDIISRAMGQSEEGAFGGLTRIFARVNMYLAPFLTHRRPVGIYDIVNAFDRVLTPRTHAIMSMFQLLSGILSGLNFQFTLLGHIIQGLVSVLTFLPRILGLTNKQAGTQEFVMRQLGRALSVLIFAWTLMKLRIMAAALATEYLTIREFALLVVSRAYYFTLLLTVRTFLIAVLLSRLLAVAMLRLGVVVLRATVAFLSLDAATLGWIGLATVVLGLLVVLYFRWKRFHDIVNDVVYAFRGIAISLVPLIGPMLSLVNTAVIAWHNLLTVIRAVHDLVTHPFRAVGNFFSGLAHFATHPHFAAGGVMPYTGYATINERGPETLILPGGTTVIPHKQSLAGGLKIEIHPQAIYFGNRLVGHVMSDIVTDKDARA